MIGMIGMILTGAVVTGSERWKWPKSVQQSNRECTTVIQGINATWCAILPFIIFQGRHHLSVRHKEESIPHDWIIAISENGRKKNELSLQWLKHFDEHTKRHTVGRYRLLIVDGHKSHNSLEHHQYYKENKIVTLCMPPHSSLLLQPLDVGCLAPLKVVVAKNRMCSRINHSTKLEFLPCFKDAFDAAITKNNIMGGF
jgi:hypothetical protein